VINQVHRKHSSATRSFELFCSQMDKWVKDEQTDRQAAGGWDRRTDGRADRQTDRQQAWNNPKMSGRSDLHLVILLVFNQPTLVMPTDEVCQRTFDIAGVTLFTGWMSFLSLHQQCHSTEAIHILNLTLRLVHLTYQLLPHYLGKCYKWFFNKI